MRVLFIYVVASFISDQILISHKSIAYPTVTISTLSIFTIVEFTLFSLFIFWAIKGKFFKNIIIISSSLFVLFAIIYFFLNMNSHKKFDSLPASIESIIIIIFCILFLFDQINTPEINILYESPKFWVISGFLIYMAGGLFLFIYADSFTKEQKNYYWNINAIINILKNIFIAIAFFMRKNSLASSSLRQQSYNI